jgi:hypothetical protein
MVKKEKRELSNEMKIIFIGLILFGIFMIVRFIFGAFDDQLLNPKYPRVFKFVYLSVIYAFFAIFAFINAYGLLKLKKWAKKSISALSIVFIIFLMFFTAFNLIDVIPGIFFILTVLYLNLSENVKKIFD